MTLIEERDLHWISGSWGFTMCLQVAQLTFCALACKGEKIPALPAWRVHCGCVRARACPGVCVEVLSDCRDASADRIPDKGGLHRSRPAAQRKEGVLGHRAPSTRGGPGFSTQRICVSATHLLCDLGRATCSRVSASPPVSEGTQALGAGGSSEPPRPWYPGPLSSCLEAQPASSPSHLHHAHQPCQAQANR